MEINYEQIAFAHFFAHGAHSAVKQARKYTGEPYIEHPWAVSRTVQFYNGTTDMIVAALLHDVVEDTGITLTTILECFGPKVAGYVSDLTDEYTAEDYPDSNRAERKQYEAGRYATTCAEVQTIKVADMLDTTPSIAKHDAKFLKAYGPEKRYLLGKLQKADNRLWTKADTMLIDLGY